MTGGFGSNSYGQFGFTNTITAYMPEGNSKYNGLALQLTKRYANNLSYNVAFTWSHALDDSTATVNSTWFTPRRAQDTRFLRNDWASSALDRRFRLTIAPAYDFKMFANSGWVDEECRRKLECYRDLHFPVSGVCHRSKRGRFQPEWGFGWRPRRSESGGFSVRVQRYSRRGSYGSQHRLLPTQRLDRGVRRDNLECEVHPGRSRCVRECRQEYVPAEPHQQFRPDVVEAFRDERIEALRNRSIGV